MNHMMHKPLFGKQESQKSIRNQPEISKIPESSQQEFRDADPSGQTNYYITVLAAINQLQPFVNCLQTQVVAS